MTQTLFHYTARSRSGAVIAGSMRARSGGEAIAHLRSRRLFVTSLESATSIRGSLRVFLARVQFRGASRATFLRSLAVMMEAGTSLQRALAVCMGQCPRGPFAETLRGVAADVDAGAALSEAMARRPAEFPEELTAMVRAGELGGTLEEVLTRSAALIEHREALRRRLTASLAYPCFVLAVAFGLLAFILIATVPAFASILTQLHTRLPLSTRLMLSASGMLRSQRSLEIAAALLAGVAGFVMICRRNAHVLSALSRGMLGTPLIGALQRCANVAAFARTSGMLVQCGVIITEAVRAASDVLPNQVYRRAAIEIERALHEGRALAPALERSGLFGALCVQLVAVGEESGTLDAMLLRIAEHHEAEIDALLRTLVAVLEPALIVVLGGIIGTIVASILIPLYSAIGNVH